MQLKENLVTQSIPENMPVFRIFKQVFSYACLLQIVEMHENITAILVHDNEPVVLALIEKLQSPCKPPWLDLLHFLFQLLVRVDIRKKLVHVLLLVDGNILNLLQSVLPVKHAILHSILVMRIQFLLLIITLFNVIRV